MRTEKLPGKNTLKINVKGLQLVVVSLFLLMSSPFIAFAGLHDDDIAEKSTIVWSEGSTQVINEDFIIHNNVTLVIEPGVRVEINNARIIIRGKILANGTSGQPIQFTSNHPKRWQGLMFDSGNAGSMLNHCIIEKAQYDANNQQGLFRVINTPELTIKNSWIRNNIGGLFYISRSSSSVLFDVVRFRDNEVEDKDEEIGIIRLVTDAEVTLIGCHIYDNNKLNMGGVISMDSRSVAKIFNSQIRDNSFHSDLDSEPLIERIIIRVEGSSELDVSDTRMANNDGIYINTDNSFGRIRDNSSFSGSGKDNETPTRAIRMVENSEVLISNTVFKHFNRSAIDCRFSKLFVNKSKFYHCASENDAGAIFLRKENSSASSITNNLFFANYAKKNGGAVYFEGIAADTLQLIGNHFFANEAAAGGAIAGKGGFVRMIDNNLLFNKAVVRDDAKQNSFDQGHGGGMYITNANVDFLENRVDKNSAEIKGAGAYIDSSHGLIWYNLFDGNEAGSLGGGLYLTNLLADAIEFVENVIIRNTSGEKGAGMSVVNCGHLEIKRNLISNNKPIMGKDTHRGGGAHVDNTPVTFLNSIINENESSGGFEGRDGGGVFIENINIVDTVYFLNSSIVGNYLQGVTGINIDGTIFSRNTLSYDNESQWWIDNTNSNPVFLEYSAISPTDDWHDNVQVINCTNCLVDINPMFLHPTFLIDPDSPLVDKGDDDDKYNDVHFNHPSHGWLRNDIGATGGPHAKNIKDDHPGLNIYEYNANELGRPNAYFSYEVIKIQDDDYTIKFTDESILHGATLPNYYWFWGDGTDKIFYNYNPAQHPTLTVEKVYHKPQGLEVSLFVETKGGIDSHTRLIGSPLANKPRALENESVIFYGEDIIIRQYTTEAVFPLENIQYEWEIDANHDLIAGFEIENDTLLIVTWNRPPPDQIKTVSITVQATNEPFEPGPWSEPLYVTLEIKEPASLESIEHEGFSIFPNPTGGLLHVHSNQMQAHDYKLIIMDHTGRKTLEKMVSKEVKEFSLDISAYPPGLYIAIIESAGIRQSFKLVKK